MSRPSRRRLFGLLAAAASVVALLVLVVLWGRPKAPRETFHTDDAPPRAASSPAADDGPRAKGPPQAPARGEPASDEAPDERERRLARAKSVLDNYVAWARYPPTSRPIREQPDQVQPHFVAPNKLPLARTDNKLTDAKVLLTQDRYFVVGDESVVFTITCETSDGPAPCEVRSSRAAVPAHAAGSGSDPGAPPREATVTFVDSGQDGDKAAGDGTLTGVLTPSTQGFQGYYGPIQVMLELTVEGESGRASFDIVYTPDPPAEFTGKVREVIQEGSLVLYVEMDVRKAGRYVITGRVDDEEGKSFAYVTFNEELAEGRQEAKLTVFGKLIRDEGAKSPFKLRDVEGFLLKEGAYPDRELVPALEGAAHTTKRYKEADFSDAEWQSEEKDRHVKEYQKDVEELSGGDAVGEGKGR